MKTIQTIHFPKGMQKEEAVSMMKRMAAEYDLEVHQQDAMIRVEKGGAFLLRHSIGGGWQSGWLYGTDSVKLLLTSSPVVPGPTVSGVHFLLTLAVIAILARIVLGMPWEVAVFAVVLACGCSLIANGIAVATYEGGLLWENMKKFADALEEECRTPYKE